MIRSRLNAGPMWRRGIGVTAAAWLVALAAGNAHPVAAAESGPYPNRPIHIIAAAAAGTQLDTAARLIGAKLADAVGQPVAVENHPGASYNIASEIVAKSPADGYTLLFTGSVITLLPSTLGKAAVDPIASFAPISKLAGVPLVIVVNASLGVGTLDELLALARQRPGRIAYSTTGIGTVPHLAATVIAERAGVELIHVPYASGARAVTDLVSGEVPVSFTFMGPIDAHLRSGRLRALAVAGNHRMPAWPEIPTVVELGYKEATFDLWNGVLAPAGTPREIVDRLYREFAKIIHDPDVAERFAQTALEPVGSSPERFAADIREAVVRWPPIVRAAGIHPD